MDMTPADVAAVTRNNDGWGDGCGMGMGGGWLAWILIFALLGGGGFGRFGDNRGNAATTEDLASGFNFSALQGKTNDILAAVNNNNQVLGNAICNLGYQDAQHTYDLSRQIADCCCTTQRGIDSVKFDMANYSAATNAAITAGAQKILDKMCENEKAAMAARIQSLELQQALCGVIRYPTATTYAVPSTCFGFNGNCGCNNCAY